MSAMIRMFRWPLVVFLVGSVYAAAPHREAPPLASFVPAGQTVLFISVPDWQSEISDYEKTVWAMALEETDVAMVTSNLWGDGLEASKAQFLSILGENEFYMVLNKFDQELALAILAPNPAPEKGLRLNLPLLSMGEEKPPVFRIMFIARLKVPDDKQRKIVLGQFAKLCQAIKDKARDNTPPLMVTMTGNPDTDKQIMIRDPVGGTRTDGIILSAEVRKDEFFFLGLGDIPVWEMAPEKTTETALKALPAYAACVENAAVYTPAMISRLKDLSSGTVPTGPAAAALSGDALDESYRTPLLRVFLNTRHPLILDRLKARFPAEGMAALVTETVDQVDGVGIELHTCNSDEFAGKARQSPEKGQRPIIGRAYLSTTADIGSLTGLPLMMDILTGYDANPAVEFKNLCDWRVPAAAENAFTARFDLAKLKRLLGTLRSIGVPAESAEDEPFDISSRKIMLRLLDRLADKPDVFTGKVSFVSTSEGFSAVAGEQSLVAFLELSRGAEDKAEAEKIVVDLCDIRADAAEEGLFATDQDERYEVVKPQNMGIWPNRPKNSEVLFAFAERDPSSLILLFTPQLGPHVTTSVIPDLLEPIDEETAPSRDTDARRFGEAVFLLKNGTGTTGTWAAPHPVSCLLTSEYITNAISTFFIAGDTDKELAGQAAKAFARQVQTALITAGKMAGQAGAAKGFTIDFSVGMPPAP